MARARVLICEDEGLTSLRLQSSLRKLGYEVVGDAKDGAAAVAAAAQLAPDVILMDIRMPKLDGIAATQQIMSRKATAIVEALRTFSERLTGCRDTLAPPEDLKAESDALREP